jgi:hypothetical protein
MSLQDKVLTVLKKGGIGSGRKGHTTPKSEQPHWSTGESKPETDVKVNGLSVRKKIAGDDLIDFSKKNDNRLIMKTKHGQGIYIYKPEANVFYGYGRENDLRSPDVMASTINNLTKINV